MKTEDYLKQFNNDSSFRKLKEKYSSPSFFEISEISRSETVHSSILAWLFKGSEIISSKQYTPIMGLLDILIERDGQRNGNTIIDNEVKNAIISRTISISNIKVKCEQSIGKLGVAKNSKDRIDIYIVCDVCGLDKYEQFEIVIENKIKSKEGNEKLNDFSASKNKELSDFEKYYNNLKQTERYVLGTDYQKRTIGTDKFCNDVSIATTNKWIKDTHKIQQFYVFLTPISSFQLSDYPSIDPDDTCESDRFIHINYQDIVDHIIDPIISSNSQTAKVQVFLEQYLNTLSMPYFDEDNDEESDNTQKKDDDDKRKKSIIMATKNEDKELILYFWEKYSEIIMKSISIHECINIDSVKSRQTLFNEVVLSKCSDYKSKKINLDDTFGEGIVIKKKKNTHLKISDDPSLWACKVSTKTKNAKLWPKSKVSITFLEIIKSKECFSELYSLYNFFEKNKTIILASLNILSNNSDSNFNQVRELYDKLISSAKPKYIIKYKETILNKKNNRKVYVGMNLHETIKAFVENVLKQKTKEDVRKFFNNIKLNFAPEKISGINDRFRYDVYVLNDQKYSFSCRADCYDETSNQTDYFIVSTQWGSLENGKGTFDFFLKEIKDKYPDFKIQTIDSYLQENKNSNNTEE